MPAQVSQNVSLHAQDSVEKDARTGAAEITEQEYQAYLDSGQLPNNFSFAFDGGEAKLIDGKIVVANPEVIINKTPVREFTLFSQETWDYSSPFLENIKQSFMDALRAIIPLCLFLYVVLRMVLRQRLGTDNDVGVGVAFALVGMTLFGLGIILGLTPLGSQLGGNIPLTFASIVPWGLDLQEEALFSPHLGKMIAVVFAFFLGYGATLAEPALNALGDTVEKITVGAFRKKLLMQSVAMGVGLGIAAGIIKMIYNFPLFWMLMPAYGVVLVLTWFSPHSFVNFAWDSAGVTTGPITVPLVLAMGLGIGGNIPGVSDGFGILALASVGPIMTVLTVGLYTKYTQRQLQNQELQASESDRGSEYAESGVSS
ncbi:MAG TPA: hypothetical protein DD979_09360 [Gammaproteobacteria bacterium]|nr:hypothetical protein [Gammaproteobacteria bacterium]